MENTVIDKEKLTKSFNLVALRVTDKLCGDVIKVVKGYCWQKTKHVVLDQIEVKKRLVILNESIVHDDLRELTETCRKFIHENGIEITRHTLQIGYDQMTADEVFQQLLPSHEDMVTSFESVGHIAHMNLTNECLPYKKIIGQVILDKNKHIKTVVNKLGEIHNTYRTFNMEILAGIDDMNTEVKESGCRFRFNFAEVYWNSRLSTEHDRLVKLFKPNQIIVDMFAGIGPFAIPAAKAGCTVYANDLNPRSYFYLQNNAKLNKCDKKVYCFNLDGRDFIRRLVLGTENVEDTSGVGKQLPHIDHVIMNLPASAIEFLDVFRGLNFHNQKLPTIHCYGFSKADDVSKDIVEQAEKVLGTNIENASVINIRLVAPKKCMARISFQLPLLQADKIEEPPLKKRKKESVN